MSPHYNDIGNETDSYVELFLRFKDIFKLLFELDRKEGANPKLLIILELFH